MGDVENYTQHQDIRIVNGIAYTIEHVNFAYAAITQRSGSGRYGESPGIPASVGFAAQWQLL